MEILQSLIGLIAFPALAWAVSENRRAFPWRIAALAVLAQLAVAFVLLGSDTAKGLFFSLNHVAEGLQNATAAGTGLVFGYLGGGPLPFEETRMGASFILAFQSLPLVFVISALSALLWHWRILPAVIGLFSSALKRLFNLNGATGLASAANIFVGMVEAPLLVRPVFSSLSRADIFLIMTCGMATIAGTVLVLYASIVSPVLPNALGHLLIASVISVPAAVAVSRIMIPARNGNGNNVSTVTETEKAGDSSGMEALARGTQQGISLYLTVVAILIVFVALVYICNSLLAFLPVEGGVTLQGILGVVFRPLVWLTGIPWEEAQAAGSLMGIKTVLNEFVAYLEFAEAGGEPLGERSKLIMLYAMSGFANFSSVGIMVGGLSVIAPERRGEIASLGMLSLVSGTLATCMTGAVVGIVG